MFWDIQCTPLSWIQSRSEKTCKLEINKLSRPGETNWWLPENNLSWYMIVSQLVAKKQLSHDLLVAKEHLSTLVPLQKRDARTAVLILQEWVLKATGNLHPFTSLHFWLNTVQSFFNLLSARPVTEVMKRIGLVFASGTHLARIPVPACGVGMHQPPPSGWIMGMGFKWLQDMGLS